MRFSRAIKIYSILAKIEKKIFPHLKISFNIDSIMMVKSMEGRSLRSHRSYNKTLG